MISVKNALVCTIVLLSVQAITAVKGNAAPAETSHWNSNTFGNLNTLSDKTTVTFSVEYNETGTIEWFKDGIMADTLSGATSAQFTTSWSETGMKEVKARMTNGGGMSAETAWPVEVQEMGTATVSESTWLINYSSTLVVDNGWANFPTLYLKSRKPDQWIEYVERGTYIIKSHVAVKANGILQSDGVSARIVKLRALPSVSRQTQPVAVCAYTGGTIDLDNMLFLGWDIAQSSGITVNDVSPVLRSLGNSTLKLTNSEFRHVLIQYLNDTSPDDLLDHNEFYEGNPYNVHLDHAKYQVITHNLFNNGWKHNIETEVPDEYTYNDIEYNQFIGDPANPDFGDNVLAGRGSKYIGNEFIHAGWNLAEIYNDTFCRDNVLHDSGGNHNGFNTLLKNIYFYNNYIYDFPGWSAFYTSLQDTGSYPVPMAQRPDHLYLINFKLKNVNAGLSFCSGYNCYIYNLTADSSVGCGFSSGCDNNFVRKCRFNAVLKPALQCSFSIIDDSVAKYGYIENITLMDSVFTGVNKADIGVDVVGNAVLNVINCCRLSSTGTITLPTTSVTRAGDGITAKPKICFYAWLDAEVKDSNGRLVKDAVVTIDCLTAETSTTTLQVTLPPPPPDLWDLPTEPLPLPALAGFTRLKTLSTGKLPGPNYGWSENPEPCVALMTKKMSKDISSGSIWLKTTAGYQYRIKATYHGLEASQTVSPDETWLCEIPTAPVHTVQLVLNGDSTAGTDTTPPTLSIAFPQNNKPVSGDVQISAIASDNWDIEKLEIFVDNVSRAVISADSCTWTADSYICSWNWDTAQESDGVHNIKVVAYDISGNMTERTVTMELLAHASETENNSIVYPNPYIKGQSQGNVCVFANLPPDATVRIYGISGDLVTTLTAETNGDKASAEWDVSKAGGGIYLYTINSSKGMQKGKIGIVK